MKFLAQIDREITEDLGNVLETFVDPFHLGCHGGNHKPYNGKQRPKISEQIMLLPARKIEEPRWGFHFCVLYTMLNSERGRTSAKNSLLVIQEPRFPLNGDWYRIISH